MENKTITATVTGVIGRGVTGIELEGGNLVFVLSDGSRVDLGSVVGPQGEQGEKGNVLYATFEIDPATGELTMFHDEEYDGPEFRLRDDGFLEVVING